VKPSETWSKSVSKIEVSSKVNIDKTESFSE
jgi:hypothetical protein